MTPKPKQQWYTVAQVAAHYGVHVDTVYGWMHDGVAGADGATVTLSSSNEAATPPASVTVPAGSTSVTFAVSTSPVTVSTPVTISASYSGGTRTASLTVLPPSLSSLTLMPASVVGGPMGSSTGRVRRCRRVTFGRPPMA